MVYTTRRIRLEWDSTSVPPALEVRSGRCGLKNPLDRLGDEPLMLAKPGGGVGARVVSVPAVLRPVAVVDLAAVVGVLGALEELLDEVDGVVQVEVVHVAYVDVDLSFEPRTELRPVALEDIGEVVVLPPELGDVLVDDSRLLVPDALRIAVFTGGREHGFPDVPLLSRAGLRPQDQLQPVQLGDGRAHVTQVVSQSRPRGLLPVAVEVVGVLILIDVDHGIRAEVDGIGAGGIAPVVLVGIEDLHPERLPSARRPSVEEAGPTLTEAPEPFLDLGNQLVGDGVAVGTEVLGVHRVGVVVVGVRMLDLDRENPREVRPGPVLVEPIRVLLLRPVVALPPKTLAVLGLQVWIRRLLAESTKRVGEVAVEDHERIAGLGMRVEAFRKKHVSAEMHRPPPELRQELALDLDVLDVLRLRGIGTGRDLLIEGDAKRPAFRGVNLHLDRLVVEVFRGPGPFLALPTVHPELYHVTLP